MTLEQRIKYLEIRDKNSRVLIEHLSKQVDLLSDGLMAVLFELEISREVITVSEVPR